MAQTVRSINKQVGTPLEVAAVIRRLATPAVIQPTYTFDVSDLHWYAFDGIDTYEAINNNQYFNLYGTNGITVGPPTKSGNIVYQEIGNTGPANQFITFNTKTSNYTVQYTDNNNVIDASGNVIITLPNSLPTGFSTIIMNMGGGNITLNASTLLTADASITIRSQYTGASAMHKGSGVWTAFGNLT